MFILRHRNLPPARWWVLLGRGSKVLAVKPVGRAIKTTAVAY
jgi:hypothetical protein